MLNRLERITIALKVGSWFSAICNSLLLGLLNNVRCILVEIKLRIKSFPAWPREFGLISCIVNCVLVMLFLVDVVRLLDCGIFCSVCYARLARVPVAPSLCLEKIRVPVCCACAGCFECLVSVRLLRFR